MTGLLLPSGATPYALLPATTLTTATASAPALRLVENEKLPRYKYALGEWVFAPTQYTYPAFDDAQVIRRDPRRITKRWQRGGQNWYAVAGHPWVFHEDELTLYQNVIDFSYHRRVQAVAAA